MLTAQVSANTNAISVNREDFFESMSAVEENKEPVKHKGLIEFETHMEQLRLSKTDSNHTRYMKPNTITEIGKSSVNQNISLSRVKPQASVTINESKDKSLSKSYNTQNPGGKQFKLKLQDVADPTASFMVNKS